MPSLTRVFFVWLFFAVPDWTLTIMVWKWNNGLRCFIGLMLVGLFSMILAKLAYKPLTKWAGAPNNESSD